MKKKNFKNDIHVINKKETAKYILDFGETYRAIRYSLLAGNHLDEYHSFGILLRYSNDGIIRQNQWKIIPHNILSNAATSYVVSINNNLLFISFQIDKIYFLNDLQMIWVQ